MADTLKLAGNPEMPDYRPCRITALCCVASILVSFAVRAQQAHWSPYWDALAARPDVKVIDGINDKGEQTRRIEFPSGVSYNLERKGNDITSYGADSSGHGAVQCSWEIYVGVRSYVEACLAGEDPGFEARLDDALDRVNDFIVENSLVPITKSQLQDAVAQRKRAVQEAVRGQADDDRRKKCDASALRPLAAAMKSMSHDAWVAGLNSLLSVKRPPVMNPCL